MDIRGIRGIRGIRVRVVEDERQKYTRNIHAYNKEGRETRVHIVSVSTDTRMMGLSSVQEVHLAISR